MAALRLLRTKNHLYEELCCSKAILGKRIDYVYNFLSSLGITSLSEVTADTLTSYIKKVRRDFPFESSKVSSYKGDLEVLYYTHQKNAGHPLTCIMTMHGKAGSIDKKCATFLMASGISSPSEITGKMRLDYTEYLNLSVPKKCTEYVKGLDALKLSDLEKTVFKRDLSYETTLLYLGYHPDVNIAKRFYYTARKEFLYFDFSLPAPETLKRQIFSILKNDLSHMDERTNHYQIQQYITPLYYLYRYCFLVGIYDIKQISEDDAAGFASYLESAMDSISRGASQAMYRARKYLFLSDKKTDFTATAWFLERFTLSDERMNPTRIIDAFYFGDIENMSDRASFQHYMRYLLVLSPKYSMQTILEKYYGAKDFIQFLKGRHSSLDELSYSDIEDYITAKDEADMRPETFNRTLTMLSFFLQVLRTREKLLIPSFPFDYYYKKNLYLHHDRSVPEEKIDAIMSVLYDFPENLGLIFLTLYSTGLRINEVCSLRKDAVFSDKGTWWLKIYQYKMYSDKQIPIPEELARLLTRYIKNGNPDSDYIFPSIKNPKGPYQAATFVKQMKAQLLLYDETSDIDFRSHDFRHTIATDLHFAGAKIATTRAFLGHKRDDMTKQYIDHLPGKIERMQDEYFKENHLE